MLHKLVKFFTSLRLTVVLLGFALVLVFFGTVAQEPMGLYLAQERFFRALFVDAASFWAATKKILQMVNVYLTPSTSTDVLSAPRIPVFPGGWLIGGLLLINLIAAHIQRFQFTKKKAGIFLIHLGLILLLLGQFITELFQVESTLRLAEGETRNYTEDSRRLELAIVDTSDPERDTVISIPFSMVEAHRDLQHERLPFTIRIKELLPNSRPATATNATTVSSTEGIGRLLAFMPKPLTASMEDENKPAALVEITTKEGSLGTWILSTWMTKYPWPEVLEEKVGDLLDGELRRPQAVTVEGRTYEMALRPVRYYKPYEMTLIDFRHDLYPGTTIPKNFSSKIHLSDPTQAEEREILIFMNNPLRYAGETFYQSGFLPGDTGTILQVVRNPAAITPYVSCTLVGLGMLVQFLMHLVNFGRKRGGAAPGSDAAPAAKSGSAVEPALIANKLRTQ